MSKSRTRDTRRIQYDDYSDDYGVDHQQSKQKRMEKRLRNIIRSNNVDYLIHMDEEEESWKDYRHR